MVPCSLLGVVTGVTLVALLAGCGTQPGAAGAASGTTPGSTPTATRPNVPGPVSPSASGPAGARVSGASSPTAAAAPEPTAPGVLAVRAALERAGRELQAPLNIPGLAYLAPVPTNRLPAAHLLTPAEALDDVPAAHVYEAGPRGRRVFLALKSIVAPGSPGFPAQAQHQQLDYVIATIDVLDPLGGPITNGLPSPGSTATAAPRNPHTMEILTYIDAVTGTYAGTSMFG